jgi:hypothetical protein
MFRVGTEAAERELRVISNTDWKAEITPSDADYTAGGWIMLSRTSGRGSANVSIFIEPYTDKSAEGRQATIKFTTADGKAVATVAISQSHQESVLEIMPEELEIGSAAQSVNFMVLSNTEWTLSGDCPWARVVSPTTADNNGDVMVTIEVDEYESHGENRSFNFFLTAGKTAESVGRMFTLIQRGQPDPTLILGHENLFFDAIVRSGVTDNFLVPFITNVDEDKGDLIAVTNQPWLKAEIVTNNGVRSVKISVTSHDQSTDVRTGEVYVTASVGSAPATKKLAVTQSGSAAPDFEVMRDVITIDDKTPGADPNVAFSFKFIPIGNATVQLLHDFDSWITASIDSADPTKVNVVAQPNYTNETRTTSISLYAEGSGTYVKKSVTVIQRVAGEFNLQITPEATGIGIEEQTVTYYVVSDLAGVKFTATGNKSWVDVSAAPEVAGLGFGGTVMKFTAKVDANGTAAGRTAAITVLATYGMKSDHVVLNLTQDGTGAPEAVVGSNAVTVPVAGADYSIGVGNSEGTTITAASTAPWIVGKGGVAGSKPSFNTATKTIDFAVLENNLTQAARTGIIDILVAKGGATQILSIAVTQLGMGSAELVIAQSDYTLNSAATTLEIPVIAQNGTWRVLGVSSAEQAMFGGIPTKTAGAENDLLTIELTANNTTQTRTGSVNLLASNGDSNVTYTINITQRGLEPPTVTPIATEVRVSALPSQSAVQVALLDWDSTIDLSAPLYVTPAEMFDGTMTKVVTNDSSATLNIGVTANEALAERRGVVTVTAKRGGHSALYKVTVIQAAANAPTLLFPDYSYSFGPGSQDNLKVIFQNVNGATIKAETYPEWFAAAPVIEGTPNSSITFRISENGDDEARTGTIVLKATLGANVVYYNVAVAQAGQSSLGAMLSASNVILDWNANGQITTPVISILNLPTTPTPAVEITAMSSAGWLGVASPVAVANGAATLALTSNGVNPTVQDRSAVVQVLVRQGTQIQPLTLTVTQKAAPAPTAYLAAEVLNVSATQGSPAPVSFAIPFLNTNDNVSYGNPFSDNVALKWAEASVENNIFEVRILSANEGVDTRTVRFTIPITAAGITTAAHFTVNQYGTGDPVLNLGTTSLLVGSKGQNSVKVFFENPNDASLSVASWPAGVTLNSGDSSLSNGILAFDVAPALGTDARTGDIVLRAEKGGKVVYYSVTVSQNGLAALNPTMSPASITAGPEANSITEALRVLDLPTSGVTVSYTSSQPWLAAGATSTSLSSSYAFTPAIEKNTAGAMRQGTIIVEIVRTTDPSEVVYLTVGVTQTGAKSADLLADWTGFVLAKDAGDSQRVKLINYTNAYKFDVQYSVEWLIASFDDFRGSLVIESLSDNTAAEPRVGTVTLTITKPNGELQTMTIGVMQEGTVPPEILYPISGINAASGVTFAWNDQGKDTGKAKTIEVFGFDINQHDIRFGDLPSWLNTDVFETYFRLYTEEVNSSPTARSTELDITILIKGTSTIVGQFSIPVTQLGFQNDKVYADPTGVVFAKEADIQKTVILKNYIAGDLTDLTIQRSADWFIAGKDASDNLQITTASANTSATPRVGTVTVTITQNRVPVQTLVVGVMQEGTVPPEIRYPIGGISAASGVSFEPWEYQLYEARKVDIFGFDEDVHDFSYSAPSWITVVPPSSPMMIHPTSANTDNAPRTGKVDITILVKDTQTVVAQFSIPVTQLGRDSERPEVTFTPGSHSATSVGGDVTVKVSNPSANNAAVWTTSTDHPAWLTDISYDLPNNNLHFTVQLNPTPEARSGYIILTDPTENFQYSFPVTQAASTSSLDIGSATADWNVTSGSTAITGFVNGMTASVVNPSAGLVATASGSTVEWEIPENPDGVAKTFTATVEVTHGTTSQYLNLVITQGARPVPEYDGNTEYGILFGETSFTGATVSEGISSASISNSTNSRGGTTVTGISISP